MSWQPIETAPMGVPFLGYGDKYDPEYVSFEVCRMDSRGVIYQGYDGNEYTETPTHWMPLPAPPNE